MTHHKSSSDVTPGQPERRSHKSKSLASEWSERSAQGPGQEYQSRPQSLFDVTSPASTNAASSPIVHRSKFDQVSKRESTLLAPTTNVAAQQSDRRSAVDLQRRSASKTGLVGEEVSSIELMDEDLSALMSDLHEKGKPMLTAEEIADITQQAIIIKSDTRWFRDALHSVTTDADLHPRAAFHQLSAYYESLLNGKEQLDIKVNSLEPRLAEALKQVSVLQFENKRLTKNHEALENADIDIRDKVRMLDDEKFYLNKRIQELEKQANRPQRLTPDGDLGQIRDLQATVVQLESQVKNLKKAQSVFEEEKEFLAVLMSQSDGKLEQLMLEMIMSNDSLPDNIRAHNKTETKPEPQSQAPAPDPLMPGISIQEKIGTAEHGSEQDSQQDQAQLDINVRELEASESTEIPNDIPNVLKSESSSFDANIGAAKAHQAEASTYQFSSVYVMIDMSPDPVHMPMALAGNQNEEMLEKSEITQILEEARPLVPVEINESSSEVPLALDLESELSIIFNDFAADQDSNVGQAAEKRTHIEDSTPIIRSNLAQAPQHSNWHLKLPLSSSQNPTLSGFPKTSLRNIGSKFRDRSSLPTPMRLPSIPEFEPLQTSILQAELQSERNENLLTTTSNQIKNLIHQTPKPGPWSSRSPRTVSRSDEFQKLWDPHMNLIQTVSRTIDGPSGLLPSSLLQKGDILTSLAERITYDTDLVTQLSKALHQSFSLNLEDAFSDKATQTTLQDILPHNEFPILDQPLSQVSNSGIDVAKWASEVERDDDLKAPKTSESGFAKSDLIDSNPSKYSGSLPAKTTTQALAFAQVGSLPEQRSGLIPASKTASVTRDGYSDRSTISAVSPKTRIPRRKAAQAPKQLDKPLDQNNEMEVRPTVPTRRRILYSALLPQALSGSSRVPRPSKVQPRRVNDITNEEFSIALQPSSSPKPRSGIPSYESQHRRSVSKLPSRDPASRHKSIDNEELMRDIEALLSVYGQESVLRRLSERLSSPLNIGDEGLRLYSAVPQSSSFSATHGKVNEVQSTSSPAMQHLKSLREQSWSTISSTDISRSKEESNAFEGQLTRDSLSKYRPVSIVESLGNTSDCIDSKLQTRRASFAEGTEVGTVNSQDKVISSDSLCSPSVSRVSLGSESVRSESSTSGNQSREERVMLRTTLYLLLAWICQMADTMLQSLRASWTSPLSQRVQARATDYQLWLNFACTWLTVTTIFVRRIWHESWSDLRSYIIGRVSKVGEHYTVVRNLIGSQIATVYGSFSMLATSIESVRINIPCKKYTTSQIVSFGWWTAMLWLLLATHLLKMQWDHGNSVRPRTEVPLWYDEHWAFSPAESLRNSMLHVFNQYSEPVSSFT